jgi:hypothetical protein
MATFTTVRSRASDRNRAVQRRAVRCETSTRGRAVARRDAARWMAMDGRSDGGRMELINVAFDARRWVRTRK